MSKRKHRYQRRLCDDTFLYNNRLVFLSSDPDIRQNFYSNHKDILDGVLTKTEGCDPPDLNNPGDYNVYYEIIVRDDLGKCIFIGSYPYLSRARKVYYDLSLSFDNVELVKCKRMVLNSTKAKVVVLE